MSDKDKRMGVVIAIALSFAFLLTLNRHPLPTENEVVKNENEAALTPSISKKHEKPQQTETPWGFGPLEKGEYIEGIASWYDYDLEGHPGYSRSNLTAASRDIERGKYAEVCKGDFKGTLDCVIVRINDYGPDASVFPDRTIDLSSAAFDLLAPLETGVIKVYIRELPWQTK